MKFLISSLQSLQAFQKQCIHVRLSELSNGSWNSHISSLLFENVHFSIRKPLGAEQTDIVHTSLLRTYHFLTGSSLLNSVDSVKGGVVRFPTQDLLKIWVKQMQLPKTLAMQEFLERIFQLGYELLIIIIFAKPQTLCHTDISNTDLPVLDSWTESIVVNKSVLVST